MTNPNSHRLRMTFGEDAGLYDRCRPRYPQAMFDDLRTLVGSDANTRVLEIGCGTGQATVPLAQAGCAITAVELSESLAALAARNLAEFPHTDVVVAAFEDWPLPEDGFDLVLAATSFHWLDPDVRVAKTAEALRAGGSLAIVSTQHVDGGTRSFFTDAQRCYVRFNPPTTTDQVALPEARDVPHDSDELDRTGRFDRVQFRRYEWEHTYRTADYLDLVSTYSGHRDLSEEARTGLLNCLARLIDDQHGGRITKRYLTQLAVARLSTPASNR